MKPFRWLCLLLLWIAGCAPTPSSPPLVLEDPPAPLAPTQVANERVVALATATSQPVEETPTAADETGWAVVEMPMEDLDFQLPTTWQHYGQDTCWSPDEGKTRLCLHAAWVEPGKETEKALISPATNLLDVETRVIGEHSVRRYHTEEYDMFAQEGEGEVPLAGYGAHYFLRAPDNSQVFDFFLLAPTDEELAQQDAFMEQVIGSVVWGNLTQRP